MSNHEVPSLPETLLTGVVGAVPAIGGLVQPLLERALAADHRRNQELVDQLNAELDAETLDLLSDDPRVDAFVLSALRRASGSAWRQQREILGAVVVRALREHSQGNQTAIEDGELFVSSLMDLTPTLVAGLTMSVEIERVRQEYKQAAKDAKDKGEERPVQPEPPGSVPPLVKARLIALGLLQLGPTTYGQTPFVPTPAAYQILDLLTAGGEPGFV